MVDVNMTGTQQNQASQRIIERIQGTTMAVVLAAGFAMGMMALNTPSAKRQLANVSDGASLLAGRTAAVVNYAMAHNLPVDVLFRTAGGVLRWRLFHSGGPQVWAGKQDWLYLIEELRPWPDAEAAMQTRADTVQRVAADLQGKGIDLLVALVPDKARIESETMDGPHSAQANAREAAFLALLRARGVHVVNLAETFMAQADRPALYYRTDTHWSQIGAAVAAHAIAGAVTTAIDRSHVFKTTADAAETDGVGDLLRLMSLDAIPDSLPIKLRPPIDRQHLEHTIDTTPPAAAGGLLDDGPSIEVALVGSSYSVNANFAGRLQEALGALAGNFAEAGGGFAGSARHYFASKAYQETPPKLVIWEIPERVVPQPLGADDKALEAVFP